MGDLGRVASPFAIGFIAQALVLGAAAVAVAGVGVLGAAVMALLVPETLRRPRERRGPDAHADEPPTPSEAASDSRR